MTDALSHQANQEAVCVQNVSLGYGDHIILQDIDFSIRTGEIVTILGGSGCGKSTLLKGLIGLLPPLYGSISIAGEKITGKHSVEALATMRRKIGVLFQSGGLIGSLSLAENIALPVKEFSNLPEDLIYDLVRLKLELVQLGDYADYLPSELSGGMRKRAGLARAMALDPQILFCDEPSAGLDPVTSAEMDRLIIEINRAMGISIVVVTHELASIESISQRSIMLDREAKGIIAIGRPEELKADSDDPRVRAFFNRSPAEWGRKP